MSLHTTSNFNHIARLTCLALFVYSAAFCIPAFGQSRIIGMHENGQTINAYEVPAQIGDAPNIVVLGSLSGDRASANVTQAAYEAYVNEPENFLNVIFIPSINPNGAPLTFPPQGSTYKDNWTAWSLWNWLAAHAPDGVIIMGGDNHQLGQALQEGIENVGSIPSVALDYESELNEMLKGRKNYPRSAGNISLESRVKRSTETMAEGLADVYGQGLDNLTYIPGMALIGRMRLGQIDEVESIVATYLNNSQDTPINNSLQIAGHLVFAELAERTAKGEYLALAKRAADLGFDANGNMLEAMPFHGDYSDAFFMATPLLAKVGKLTGETRYFDLALSHVEFLHQLLLREDGLYNHWTHAQAAWGRGNAFVALGLALTLTDFPTNHQGYPRLLAIYQAHMRELLKHVDVDGMWHNIINMPGTWAELSATAMIATAIQRGVNHGWLEGFYQNVVNRAWEGVRIRTDADYGFLNVCASTPGQDSLEKYINRDAIQGRDARAGGMMLMLATELLQTQ